MKKMYCTGQVKKLSRETITILDELIKEIKKFGRMKAARLSGVPFDTIVNWCQGRSTPTLVNAQRVADAMGLEFLLFEKE